MRGVVALSKDRVLGVVSIAALFLMWEWLVATGGSPALKGVNDVLGSLIELLTGPIWPHVISSLEIMGAGIGLSVLIGIPLGVLMSEFKVIRSLVLPPLDGARTIAALSLFPVLIVLMGIGFSAKVFIIAWVGVPIVLVAAMAAVDGIDDDSLEAARVDGANRVQVLLSIKLPLSAVGMLTGVRIAIGTTWMTLVAAEMLGATRGLGWFIVNASQFFKFSELYAAILVVAVIGYVLSAVTRWLEGVYSARLYRGDISLSRSEHA